MVRLLPSSSVRPKPQHPVAKLLPTQPFPYHKKAGTLSLSSDEEADSHEEQLDPSTGSSGSKNSKSKSMDIPCNPVVAQAVAQAAAFAMHHRQHRLHPNNNNNKSALQVHCSSPQISSSDRHTSSSSSSSFINGPATVVAVMDNPVPDSANNDPNSLVVVESLLTALSELQSDWRQKHEEVETMQSTVTTLSQALRESEEQVYRHAYETEQLQLKLQMVSFGEEQWTLPETTTVDTQGDDDNECMETSSLSSLSSQKRRRGVSNKKSKSMARRSTTTTTSTAATTVTPKRRRTTTSSAAVKATTTSTNNKTKKSSKTAAPSTITTTTTMTPSTTTPPQSVLSGNIDTNLHGNDVDDEDWTSTDESGSSNRSKPVTKSKMRVRNSSSGDSKETTTTTTVTTDAPPCQAAFYQVILERDAAKKRAAQLDQELEACRTEMAQLQNCLTKSIASVELLYEAQYKEQRQQRGLQQRRQLQQPQQKQEQQPQVLIPKPQQQQQLQQPQVQQQPKKQTTPAATTSKTSTTSQSTKPIKSPSQSEAAVLAAAADDDEDEDEDDDDEIIAVRPWQKWSAVETKEYTMVPISPARHQRTVPSTTGSTTILDVPPWSPQPLYPPQPLSSPCSSIMLNPTPPSRTLSEHTSRSNLNNIKAKSVRPKKRQCQVTPHGKRHVPTRRTRSALVMMTSTTNTAPLQTEVDVVPCASYSHAHERILPISWLTKDNPALVGIGSGGSTAEDHNKLSTKTMEREYMEGIRRASRSTSLELTKVHAEPTALVTTSRFERTCVEL